MKVECVQDKLVEALAQAEKITGKNLSLPVLGCVLIEATKNQLVLKATNLDLGIEKTIPAKIDEVGVIAVPGAVLSSLVSNMAKEKSVKFQSDDTTLQVKTSKNKAVIKCLPNDDFPTIPQAPGEKLFSIPAQDLVKGLKSVFWSSSVSNVKPELSSVYIHKDDGMLVFAATDSFRLAEKKIKVKDDLKSFEHCLIPFKNVSEIIRILDAEEGVVDVYANKNQASFVFAGTYLTSRVVEGNFPDYNQIIPKTFKTESVLLKNDLAESLKIANIFSDSFSQVGLSVNPEGKSFEITTKNNTVGENTTSLSAALTGEMAEANFNCRYIGECLQSISSDSITLSFAGAGKPMVMRGVSDKSFTYLVMPMNR